MILTNQDGKRGRAVSFCELRDGGAARETDSWPEPYAAPTQRAQWVGALDEQ